MPRPLLILLAVVVALVAHGIELRADWEANKDRHNGADFASYYYAAGVARAGGNPYRPRQLSALARENKRQGPVHPFFYPPPFLALVWWAPATDLLSAYRIWAAIDVVASLACLLILGLWWRELGSAVPLLLATALVAFSAIGNNHVMGQANLPVMALTLAGLWATDRERPWLGGLLVGTACMLKMSPALFVAWWLVRWEWRAALAACLTAVGLSVASLALVSIDVQLDFYLRVLPAFADGRYNGLSVPIDMFGNHSLPNLVHQAIGGPKLRLAPAAATLSSALNGLLLVGLCVAFWWRPPDALARWAQITAVAALMLIIPVYTYEHHMVWLLPAIVLAGVAIAAGRLPRWVGAPWLLAAVVQCVPIMLMRAISEALAKAGWGLSAFLVQESKMAGLLVFFGLVTYLGTTGWRERLTGSQDD